MEQPRIGNKKFAEYFMTVIPEAYRLTHWKDIVVHVPPRIFGFHHFGTEIFHNENYLFWKCDHSKYSRTDKLSVFNFFMKFCPILDENASFLEAAVSYKNYRN